MINLRRLAGPHAGALAAPLVLAGVLAGPATATAAACQAWTGVQPTGPGTRENTFSSVAVISACNVWAVGEAQGDSSLTALIEHWNGSAWTVTPSQGPASNDVEMRGIHAVSGSDIWAVGDFEDSQGQRTLTEHWNGSAWTVVPSPSPSTGLGNFDTLAGVGGVSTDDLWAVGFGLANNTDQTLILHWDGHAWTQVPSPSPARGAILSSVTATSHTNAWAVGEAFTSSGTQTLALHWNGHKWSRVSTPAPSPTTANNSLTAVAATSGSDAWAVGDTVSNATGTFHGFVLHWDGQRWTRLASPHPSAKDFLSGVTTTSAGNAWAVGDFAAPGATSVQALILHWNGSAWSRVRAPTGPVSLSAVGASSASNVWAVGVSGSSSPDQPFVLHCC